MTNQPICMFDSGIGGLTVLKKLSDKFPDENYIYLADLARVPFGDRTAEDIKKIVCEIIEWLNKFKPKLIIMACNTSSAVLCQQGRINPAPTVPTHGIIQSCAKEIGNSTFKKVSVWATKLVVEKHGYKDAINNYNPNIAVEEISCPKLVPMIESLNFDDSAIKEYIELIPEDSECLILGCTHYPHIEKDIKKLRNIEIIDPADALVKDLEKYLTESRGVVNHVSTDERHNISLYTTAQKEKLEKFARLYLCGDYSTKLVTLSKVSA